MKYLLSRRWRMLFSIVIPLFVTYACIPDRSLVDSQTPEVATVQTDVVLGPGAFNLLDTKAGLADLSSYKATLTLAFEGTRDGQPSQWSKTYIMLTTKEPAARQLTIEKTGDLSDLNPVLMAEVDGAAYERRGENACNATVIEEGDSLAERLEPAGFLSGVIGADEAGTETVNAVETNHYTFDERAFGQADIAQSRGEMWVAPETSYIVKYVLTTRGNTDYFEKGLEGTLTWDYELTDVNQPVTFALPDDCPAGMVDAPLLPDASNVLNMPSVLAYDTASSPADAAAFYQEQIPNLGWMLVGEPTIAETMALLEFMQGDQTMAIIIVSGDNETTVQVILGNAPK